MIFIDSLPCKLCHLSPKQFWASADDWKFFTAVDNDYITLTIAKRSLTIRKSSKLLRCVGAVIS